MKKRRQGETTGPDPRWLAAQLGRLGGQARGGRKAKAARENLMRANASRRRKAEKRGAR